MLQNLSQFFTKSSSKTPSNNEKIVLNLLKDNQKHSITVYIFNVSMIIFQQKSNYFTLNQKCKMSPLYFPECKNGQIKSIDLHHPKQQFDLLTLDCSDHQKKQLSSINRVYETLKRIISHKGFSDYYKPLKRLGRGTFATVYLIEHKFTKVQKAAKVFSREGQKIQFKGKQALQNQIRILRQVDHPTIIKYDGIFQTDNLLYLITEYLSGGTLEEMMKNKCVHTGEFVSQIIRDILEGLKYLDERQIMHRDIKPQNIIKRKQDQKWILSDFGLAAKSNQSYIYNKCGTMGYIAPQIMDMNEENPKKYSQQCDIYSLGIIAYTLIIGSLPFHVESQNFFDKKIVWDLFDKPECSQLNKGILSFLQKLLQVEPKDRYKAKQALQSPFFTDSSIVQGLYQYHQKRRQQRYDKILKIANNQY